MPLLRSPFSYSTAIQQTMVASGFFNGLYPDGTDAVDNGKGLYTYGPSTTNGGLFYWNNNEPIICGQFHVDLRGSGNMSLYLVSIDSTGAVIAGSPILIEQQTAVQYVALDESRFKAVILPGQALQLVTTSVSGQIPIAQAVASIERTFVR
jgi:hypothetical protein